MSFQRIKLAFTLGDRVAWIVLNAPKANILDRAMIAELDQAFSECEHRRLSAIILLAEGPNFSFGASVQEHLPESIAATLAALHGLFRRMGRARAPVIAAVRGQCLGGGFELALACDVILAEESAVFALPEIKLGVFPPAAAALLPVKIGSAAAAHLILTGASAHAEAAASMRLVARVVEAETLEAAIDEMLKADFLPRSVNGLRYAAVASRRAVDRALRDDLPALERLYLDDLMSAAEATEGIRAFLEKRAPDFSRKVVVTP